VWQGFLLGLAKLWSLIAAIGEEFAQEWTKTEDFRRIVRIGVVMGWPSHPSNLHLL
jgi:hypothetical protein